MREAVPMDSTEQQYTIAEILSRFERDYVPSLSPRTQVDYARHCRDLRKWFGHIYANELKPRDFAFFMNVQRGKIQRNKQLAVLSCAMGEAVGRWYWADRNVCRDVKRHKSRPRDREVTDSEYKAFRRFVPYKMRLAMELSVMTGQRQGDILSMRWSQVDRAMGRIHFKQSKTGKRLGVKITKKVRRVLKLCERMAPAGEHVIRRRDGQRYTSDGFRAIWQRYQRRWKAAGHERYTYHDLRARAAGKCKNVQDAQQLLGHHTLNMTVRVYDRGEREVMPAE
jgi:integrase